MTRILDRLAVERGLPQLLRTDNGLEFCGRAMLTWAHDRRLRELTLLTEDGFRIRLTEMGLSADEVEYQLERARGLHLSVT